MAHKFDRLVEMTLDPNISGGRNISVKRNSASKEFWRIDCCEWLR